MTQNRLWERRDFMRALGASAIGGVLVGALGGETTAPVWAEDENPDTADATVDFISDNHYKLPAPDKDSGYSLEKAIANRRSRRVFGKNHITVGQLSNLLWSGQGLTHGRFRAAPSAGALYPMDLWVVIKDKFYQYIPKEHAIKLKSDSIKLKELHAAALEQDMVLNASVNLFISSVFERCSLKYRDRAPRYCMMEAGCIAENIHLQVEALNLATVIIGAFNDDKVKQVLGLRDSQRPMILMPVGTL
ncbi:SagB/ThcOx family dehydrogenase [Planctomycetota bacterium]